MGVGHGLEQPRPQLEADTGRKMTLPLLTRQNMVVAANCPN